MEIIKNILMVVYVVVAIAIIILSLIQSRESSGISSTVTGSSTNNFYTQNKGKTKEGKMKKWTVILGIAFTVLAVILSIFYI